MLVCVYWSSAPPVDGLARFATFFPVFIYLLKKTHPIDES